MGTNQQTESAAMQIGEVAKRTSPTVNAIPILREAQALAQGGSQRRSVRLCGDGTIERLRFIQQVKALGLPLREVGELIQLQERAVLRRKASQTRSQGTND